MQIIPKFDQVSTVCCVQVAFETWLSPKSLCNYMYILFSDQFCNFLESGVFPIVLSHFPARYTMHTRVCLFNLHGNRYNFSTVCTLETHQYWPHIRL